MPILWVEKAYSFKNQVSWVFPRGWEHDCIICESFPIEQIPMSCIVILYLSTSCFIYCQIYIDELKNVTWSFLTILNGNLTKFNIIYKLWDRSNSTTYSILECHKIVWQIILPENISKKFFASIVRIASAGVAGVPFSKIPVPVFKSKNHVSRSWPINDNEYLKN